jgi:hypothetical protein
VFFTSSTILTSAILFRGFKGTPTSIVTVVMGFFVICSGVVLLQLSKSAKDVPDTAVFAGDLDQMRTIAEQEQPETEPKADAIRGAAAIVRRFSTTRQKMEEKEAKRLHDEKMADLQPIGEDERIEWDGLRRRRTTVGTNPSIRSRGGSTPFPAFETTAQPPTPHPPLGMSRFPDPEDESDQDEESRPQTSGTSVSLFTRAKSIIIPAHHRKSSGGHHPEVQSPMHPVPLTEINIPAYHKGQTDGSGNAYYGHEQSPYGIPSQNQETEYKGAGERHITIVDDAASGRTGSRGSTLQVGPTPPPHSARRQFSFQNVFRKGQSQQQPHTEEHQPQSRSPMIRKGLGHRKASGGNAVKGATEEERLGLVKGDTNTGRNPQEPEYTEDYEEDDDEIDWSAEDKLRHRQSPDRSPKRDLTPPRQETEKLGESSSGRLSDEEQYERARRKWGKHPQGKAPPPPPFEDKGEGGAFI